ncbi:MAG: hypothetical protein JRI87_12605 [Deltaproteobacteria bacterium]|nr:hypothetical protein [Deltaproteobacteria bacterium]
MSDTFSRVKEIWIPVLSMLVALVGVLSGVALQYINGQVQVKLKEYEVSYDAKRQSYASVLRSALDTASYAQEADDSQLEEAIYRLETSLLKAEALMRDDFYSSTVWHHAKEFITFCRAVAGAPADTPSKKEAAAARLNDFIEQLRFDLQTGLLDMK